jgi:signal transduction histidine kinase
VLHQAQLENMEQAHHIEVVEILTRAQEDERGRIAEQLHDEVGSMLSVVRLNLSVMNDHEGKAGVLTPQQLKTVNSILGDLATTIREMSHELMPVAIRHLGFKKSILQLIDDINTANKIFIQSVIVGFDNDELYPIEFQTNVYRVVQELFQNIIKHSEATLAEFQMVEHPDLLNLLVEDNGKGINMQANVNGRGVGMLVNRIDLYNGKITIEKGGNKGTLIIIDIPLQNIVYSGSKKELEYRENLPGR